MLKVLLVEDDSDFREVLCSMLEAKDCQVTVANSGRAAIEILSTDDGFHLIISDYQMPNGNGLELLTWIRSNREIPFILMTGFASVTEEKRARDLGPNHLIAKPFASKKLFEAIKVICPDK